MAVTNKDEVNLARAKMLAAVIDCERFIDQFGMITHSLVSEVSRKIRPTIGISIGRVLAQMIFVSSKYEDIIGKLYVGVDDEDDCSLVVVDQESDAILAVEVVLMTRLSSPGILRPVKTAARFIDWRIRDLTQNIDPMYFLGNAWYIEGDFEGEIASGAKRLRHNLFDCIDRDQLERLQRYLSAPFLQ